MKIEITNVIDRKISLTNGFKSLLYILDHLFDVSYIIQFNSISSSGLFRQFLN